MEELDVCEDTIVAKNEGQDFEKAYGSAFDVTLCIPSRVLSFLLVDCRSRDLGVVKKFLINLQTSWS